MRDAYGEARNTACFLLPGASRAGSVTQTYHKRQPDAVLCALAVSGVFW